jgi:fumarate reductase (CoM/CoB) subunit A
MVRVLRTEALRLGVGEIEHKALELLQDGNGRVCGTYGVSGQKALVVLARAVVLAGGGAAAAFKTNVTPGSQTGDMWAMAYRAGCRFVNMEFFQCGPAVMKQGFKFIVHSHMWRLMPRLINVNGEEFLKQYCPNGVSPEEVLRLKAMSYPFSVRTDAKYLDIAIAKELMAGRGFPEGGVHMDVTHVPRQTLLEKAPITYEALLKADIDITAQPIPLGIAAQNFNGGILIDANGATGVQGLFAAGEVSGGVHGADRPGGNNLADTQVFGFRAGRAAAQAAFEVSGYKDVPALPEQDALWPSENDVRVMAQSEDVFYAGLTVIRDKKGLEQVLGFIGESEKKAASLPLKNRLTVGKLLARACLLREESRGTHYREDFPETEARFHKRVVLST